MDAKIGLPLSVGAGISGAYAIVGLVRLGSCAGECPDHAALLPFLFAGLLALGVASFVWRYAMVAAPVAGLVTAAVLLSDAGVDLLGANLGFTLFIVGCVLLGPGIFVGIELHRSVRAQQTEAIVRDGERAVAVVESVHGTNVAIDYQPLVVINYQIHPLDGSSPFAYRQRRTIDFNEVAPRPGLRWPAWYLAGRTDKVAIGAPAGPQDQSSLALLDEFGITPTEAFGFDPETQVAPPGAFGSSYRASSG